MDSFNYYTTNMEKAQQREYVLWLTKGAAQTLGLDLDKNEYGHKISCGHSFQRLKDKALSYSSEDIAAIGYREGEGIEKIRMVAVYNQATKELIRDKVQALEELLGQSVDRLLNSRK